MSYTDAQVSAAAAAMHKYRGVEEGEVGAALVVVGLSSERAAKEERIRDDMIRVAHRAGASIRQLAKVSGLGRKTVTAIVSAKTGLRD
jgi:endonuclease III